MGDDTFNVKFPEGVGKTITKEEALELVKRGIDNGLIPLLGRSMGDARIRGVEDTGHFLSSCFCCPCCCINAKFVYHGPNFGSRLFHRMDGISVNVDEKLCEGCGECVEGCVFKGVEFIDGKARINQSLCLGCGRCANICPTGAATIEIDDISRVDALISKIEQFVDVRDQTT
jgi:ferredoxin